MRPLPTAMIRTAWVSDPPRLQRCDVDPDSTAGWRGVPCEELRFTWVRDVPFGGGTRRFGCSVTDSHFHTTTFTSSPQFGQHAARTSTAAPQLPQLPQSMVGAGTVITGRGMSQPLRRDTGGRDRAGHFRRQIYSGGHENGHSSAATGNTTRVNH